LAITGSGSIFKCSRLSQPSWLLLGTLISLYLLTYLVVIIIIIIAIIVAAAAAAALVGL